MQHQTPVRVLAQWYAGLCVVGGCCAIPFLDPLSAVLLGLSAFLSAVVVRYSVRYLKGDPGQARFLGWLCLTSALVFVLVLANHLLVFVAAWCGVSLSLHRLLQFYGERPAARIAARKKFLISRLGDVALFGAAALIYQHTGSWGFSDIFAASSRFTAGDTDRICCLLVFAALLKSAQFPFHSWLPDTMETPTPVSALMHAGIINAGGILLLRMSPLVALSDLAMTILALVGGFTAVFASVVMLTQASIKRYLAFSTVAQMGFMMLECGLGAFHLALVHLVAHSMYKAHAFLSTGGAVKELALSSRKKSEGTVLGFVGALVAGSAMVFGTEFALSREVSGSLGMHLLFAIALAQMLRNFTPGTVAASAGACAVYFGLQWMAGSVVQPAASNTTQWVGVLYAAVFAGLSLMQVARGQLVRTKIAQRLYVMARNGFYINTVANRVTGWFWPTQTASSREVLS